MVNALINLKTYKRRLIPVGLHLFFSNVIFTARTCQYQIIQKANFKDRVTDYGVFSCIISGAIIVQSQWGQHPVTKSHYNSTFSNNLLLLEAAPGWVKKVNEYQDVKYMAFRDWYDFISVLTNEIVYKPQYQKIITCKDPQEQLDLFCMEFKISSQNKRVILKTIQELGLWEFDITYVEEENGKIAG